MNSLLRIIKLKYAGIIMVAFIISLSVLNAQDYFGLLQGPSTKFINFIEVDSNDEFHISLWGEGLLHSTDGNSWVNESSSIPSKYITNYKEHPDGYLLMSSLEAGIYKSTDGGVSWFDVNDGLDNLNVTDFAINNSGDIFAATAGGGVFRSTNDGLFWYGENEGLLYMDVKTVFVAEDDIVLAGTYGGGIYRSFDEGISWEKSNSGLRSLYIHDFTMNSIGEIFCATNGGGIVYSVDDGLSWTEYKDGDNLADRNTTCLVFNDNLELVIGTRNNGPWYYDRTINDSWQPSNYTIYGVTDIAKDSQDNLYTFLMGEGMLKSTNGGHSWSKFGYRSGNKQVFSAPFDNGLVFVQYDGGTLYKSTDYGKTWSKTGFAGVEIQKIVKNSNNVFFASTVSGILKSTDGGQNWTNASPGDDTLGIDIAGDDALYALTYIPAGEQTPPKINIHISTNDGDSWTLLKTYSDTQSGIVRVNKNTNDVWVHIPQAGLFYSTNQGTDWINIENFSSYIFDIAFDANNSIYLATEDHIYFSSDNGLSWEQKVNLLANENLPNVLNIDINNKDEIYASYASINGIYRSTDGGTEWDSLRFSYYMDKIKSLESNPEGDIYFSAGAYYKHFHEESMGIPELVSLEDGVTRVPLDPSFDWEESDKADLYELQISTTPAFNLIHERVVKEETNHEVYKPLHYSEVYFWRVRGKTDGSYSKWSEVRTFATLLTPPQLIYPENEAIGVPAEAELLWHKVKGAQNYKVEVALDSEFDNIVFTAEDIVDTTVTTDKLEYLTDYYWRVMAYSPNNESAWSDIWSFTSVIAPPHLVYPENGAEKLFPEITFKWEETEQGESYYIKLAKDEDFVQEIFFAKTENLTTQYLKLLEFNTKYYWKVYSTYDGGQSEWSEAWSFHTGLKAPVLDSPEDGAVNQPEAINFTWLKEDDAENYRLQVSEFEDFSTYVFNSSDIATNSHSITGFENNNQYWWRVRAVAEGPEGFWSQIWKFTTRPAFPILKYPADEKDSLKISFVAEWFPVEGAESYKIELSKDVDFTNIINTFEDVEVTRVGFQNLEHNTTYYWHVRAVNDGGSGEWSETWSFKTEADVSVFEYSGKPFEVQVMPNPFTSSITVSFDNPGIKPANIEIIDNLSRVVYSAAFPGAEGSQSHTIDINSLVQGAYILRLNIENSAEIIKIIKIK